VVFFFLLLLELMLTANLVVVNLILNAHPGATSEAISYPACGGQASCGSISYANSVLQGVSAVAAAVNSFNTKCPSTQLVLVGYSQVNDAPSLMG
jgi:acetylxylan esterase